jgi:hypothetical protein
MKSSSASVAHSVILCDPGKSIPYVLDALTRTVISDIVPPDGSEIVATHRETTPQSGPSLPTDVPVAI